MHHFNVPLLSPVAATFAYWVGLYALRRLRLPKLELRRFTVAHDLGLSAFSAVLLALMLYDLARAALEHGPEVLWCDARRTGATLDGRMALWFTLFYASKIYEFIDTVLLVLKGKEVIALHSFHHWSTLWVVWVPMVERVSVAWVAICANLAVHVIMYYYYAMAALGRTSVWKRWLTTAQIAQFVADIVSVVPALLHGGCSGSVLGHLLPTSIVAVFLAMFVDFYRRSYSSVKNKVL